MLLLTLLTGTLVGFSLGLTGGGGAIFAVPLLVFVLEIPAREAVGVSLLTVGATSFVGFIQRAIRGMVEFPTGLLFALAGMIGAPIGSMLADQIAEPILLGSFALLMIMIAGRMWFKSSDPAAQLPILHDDNAGPTCRRDPEGRLRLTSQCGMLLAVVGLCSGILSGMFGVGGGFIIVPALITFSCMGMQRAIGTSLLVITLVSISGTASHLIAGKELSLSTAGLFGVGSLAGLFLGGSIAHRLKGPTLQRVFAVAILFVAIYVILKSVLNDSAHCALSRSC
ncbi:MAG: sulfite exporter TauE/SafE family protein [Pirellula staleyi]